MSRVFLLRHVDAGSRETWPGEDRDRPLSAKGRRQAQALADWFEAPLAGIASSPQVRCVQSVEPLARARGMTIVIADGLVEGAPLERTLGVFASQPAPLLACSHGDVVGNVVAAAAAAGCGDPKGGLRKGSMWIFDLAPHGFVSARYLPPRI